MNGPKTQWNSHGVHNHIHGVPKPAPIVLDAPAAIAADAQTKVNASMVHETQHAQFNGRLRATSFGDRKNRPGRVPEHTEALVEHEDRKQVIMEPALDAGEAPHD